MLISQQISGTWTDCTEKISGRNLAALAFVVGQDKRWKLETLQAGENQSENHS